MTGRSSLLSVRDLSVAFPGGRRRPASKPVGGLSFDLHGGRTLALAGESGAGKSLTARALVGMAPPGARVTGSVRFHGEELLTAGRKAYARLWGRRISLIPQDALSVLSPVHPVGDQLAAAARSVRRLGRREAHAAAVAALGRVGIADAARRARAYPHEFSGGMRQRAVIAMATINAPDLVVADEPTTALDPETQDRVLDLLGSLCENTGTALILISHDLPAIRRHADRVLVLYAGRTVESGPVGTVLSRPRAPYTAGLLASLPSDEPVTDRRLPTIGGAPPSPEELVTLTGCAFAPRCPLADARCHTHTPEPVVAGPGGHRVTCHHHDDLPATARELFQEGSPA
ncbi:ABC transporter ATP-binding protein [Streptomyces chilikensis]|uniref:ABC transporter ATP-binding protein n=1 Tax=Streptomyces chilikensis TaxID=1194079 RepID=UPI0014089A12|nr:ABC transporter ATP-binding protein [Streptomyces chilikensis]